MNLPDKQSADWAWMADSIGRCLKNWAGRQLPPRDGRERLLRAAARAATGQRWTKPLWIKRLSDPYLVYPDRPSGFDWTHFAFSQAIIHTLKIDIANARMVS